MGGAPGISAGDTDAVAFQGLAQGVDGFNECGFIQVFSDDNKLIAADAVPLVGERAADVLRGALKQRVARAVALLVVHFF